MPLRRASSCRKKTHVGADRSVSERSLEVLSLGGASRQEGGVPGAGLELRPVSLAWETGP